MWKCGMIALVQPDDPFLYNNIEDNEQFFVGKLRHVDPSFVNETSMIFLGLQEIQNP